MPPETLRTPPAPAGSSTSTSPPRAARLGRTRRATASYSLGSPSGLLVAGPVTCLQVSGHVAYLGFNDTTFGFGAIGVKLVDGGVAGSSLDTFDSFLGNGTTTNCGFSPLLRRPARGWRRRSGHRRAERARIDGRLQERRLEELRRQVQQPGPMRRLRRARTERLAAVAGLLERRPHHADVDAVDLLDAVHALKLAGYTTTRRSAISAWRHSRPRTPAAGHAGMCGCGTRRGTGRTVWGTSVSPTAPRASQWRRCRRTPSQSD